MKPVSLIYVALRCCSMRRLFLSLYDYIILYNRLIFDKWKTHQLRFLVTGLVKCSLIWRSCWALLTLAIRWLLSFWMSSLWRLLISILMVVRCAKVSWFLLHHTSKAIRCNHLRVVPRRLLKSNFIRSVKRHFLRVTSHHLRFMTVKRLW